MKHFSAPIFCNGDLKFGWDLLFPSPSDSTQNWPTYKLLKIYTFSIDTSSVLAAEAYQNLMKQVLAMQMKVCTC